MNSEFEKELEVLINKHSMENASSTPDYILAEYLHNCLKTFNTALQRREAWYGRSIPTKKIATPEDEAIMLEKAANDLNYNNFCARATLGILPATSSYHLLDANYGRVRSADEKRAISTILQQRNTDCDTSRDAYNDWEITMVNIKGCPCGNNGKTIPTFLDYNCSIMQVRVKTTTYDIGQRVSNDGIIENFAYAACGRVNATVKYNLNCPFRHYGKTIDIVNLRSW